MAKSSLKLLKGIVVGITTTVGLSTLIACSVFAAKVWAMVETTIPDHEARIRDMEVNLYLVCLLTKQTKEAELKEIRLVLNINLDCVAPMKGKN